VRVQFSLVLMAPRFPVRAAWAYAAFDRCPAPRPRVGCAEFAALLAEPGAVERVAAAVYNALEFAVAAKFPIIEAIRDFLTARGALCAHVSGSGPTVFGLWPGRPPRGLAAEVRGRFGPRVAVFADSLESAISKGQS